MGRLASLVPRPLLATFLIPVQNMILFTAVEKAARGGLGARLVLSCILMHMQQMTSGAVNYDPAFSDKVSSVYD